MGFIVTVKISVCPYRHRPPPTTLSAAMLWVENYKRKKPNSTCLLSYWNDICIETGSYKELLLYIYICTICPSVYIMINSRTQQRLGICSKLYAKTITISCDCYHFWSRQQFSSTLYVYILFWFGDIEKKFILCTCPPPLYYTPPLYDIPRTHQYTYTHIYTHA